VSNDAHPTPSTHWSLRTLRSASLVKLGCLALACVAATSRLGAQAHGQEDSLRLPDVTLHYRTMGRGEPVLLLSGGPGAPSAYLEPVYVELARHAQAILLDQRGTGRSTLQRFDSTTLTLRLAVDDIEALRKRLGVEKLTLLGHSWGGQLAMAYTVAHPTRVHALVLVGSAGAGPGLGKEISEKLKARLTPLDVESIHYWAGQIGNPRRDAEARMAMKRFNTYAYMYDRRFVDERLKYVTDAELRSPTGAVMTRDLSRIGFDLRPELDRIGHDPKLRPAVAIFYGEVDPIGELSAPQIKAAFPSATVYVVARSGHYPWIEAPDVFYHELETFIAGLGRQ
jgi:proline iminopeptidase